MVTEIIFGYDDGLNQKAEFNNINGLRTSSKCLFINYDKDDSEIVLHNLTDFEIKEIKKIFSEL